MQQTRHASSCSSRCGAWPSVPAAAPSSSHSGAVKFPRWRSRVPVGGGGIEFRRRSGSRPGAFPFRDLGRRSRERGSLRRPAIPVTKEQSSLLSAVKAADVVISTVGAPQIADQTRLIDAIKEAGNVRRFIPSEFGLDADRSAAVEPTRSMFVTTKAAIRRAVEAAGVPYTYVWTGYFFGYGLPGIGQVLAQAPPVDKAVVLGDGDTDVSFVDEGDIGTYTVLAADDPRAVNTTLYVKPPANTLSHNELLALWEKKTGKTFQRVHLAEDAVLKQIQELPIPLDILLSIGHAVYIKGEHKFKMDPSSAADAGELYPDVKYTTVDDYLNRLL